VAFLKFSRDKRGYENYFLFEPPSGGRHHVHSKGRPRLLFWFRTPPEVKVGRSPFSDEVRRMVEAQNPGVSFDWARIISTPIPSADVDKWRERRRVEKAAKRAAREADAEEAPTEAIAAPADDRLPAADADADADASADAEADAAGPPADAQEALAVAADGVDAVPGEAGDAPDAAQANPPAVASDRQGHPPSGHRRRRRRRGRRGHQGPPEAPPTNEV